MDTGRWVKKRNGRHPLRSLQDHQMSETGVTAPGWTYDFWMVCSWHGKVSLERPSPEAREGEGGTLSEARGLFGQWGSFLDDQQWEMWAWNRWPLRLSLRVGLRLDPSPFKVRCLSLSRSERLRS